MATYGYLNTIRDQEPDRFWHHALIQAGVPERNIYAEIGVAGGAGVATRSGWSSVDVKLKHGDVPVVAALDRIERLPLGVMGNTTEWTNTGGSGSEPHIGGVEPPNRCSSMIHRFIGNLRFQTNIDFARSPDPYWMLAFATHPFCDSLSGMPNQFPWSGDNYENPHGGIR